MDKELRPPFSPRDPVARKLQAGCTRDPTEPCFLGLRQDRGSCPSQKMGKARRERRAFFLTVIFCHSADWLCPTDRHQTSYHRSCGFARRLSHVVRGFPPACQIPASYYPVDCQPWSFLHVPEWYSVLTDNMIKGFVLEVTLSASVPNIPPFQPNLDHRIPPAFNCHG